MIVRRPWQDGNRNGVDNIQPSPPARQLDEIVRPRQPHERGTRKTPAQQRERAEGEVGTQPRFDTGGDDAAAVGNGARRCEPLRKRRHPRTRLQRIPRRHQEPHLIEPQPPPRDARDVAVARMGGIERSTEQPDARAPPVTEGRDQERTWPLPVTK